jgi:hypothetical protein
VDDAIERGKQGLDVACASVQLLRDQQPVGYVMFAERKVVDASFGVPLVEAAPKIAFQAAAVWYRSSAVFASSFMMIAATGAGTFPPVRQAQRLSRDVAVHPLDRFGGGEWQRARQHLVERHAESVKVAPRSRSSGSCGPSARATCRRGCRRWFRGAAGLAARAANAKRSEPSESDLTRCRIEQRMGRLHILVNQPSSVKPAEGSGETDGDAQEPRGVHRSRYRVLEGVAAGILEHQHRLSPLVGESQRQYCPCGVQLVTQ